jgi:uncharacterized protein YcnI
LKPLRRASALALLTVGLAVGATLGAGAAGAHVTVAAPGVAAGASDAVITFHVPTESASASTVGVKVQLPTSTPIAGVLVAPHPGWTAKVTQRTLSTPIKTDDGDITEVVSEIDWTAEAGQGIAPGFFGEFTVIAGKLPDDVDALTFKAIQTYSDKSVVSWIEEAAPGGSQEPEHPAPILTLSTATGIATSSSNTPSVSASPGADRAVGSSGSNSDTRSTVALTLGIVGAVLGAAALAITLLGRKPTAG